MAHTSRVVSYWIGAALALLVATSYYETVTVNAEGERASSVLPPAQREPADPLVAIRMAALSPSQGASAVAGSDGSGQRALLTQYCVSCHNERLKTGNLALDTLDVTNVASDMETWEKVVRKLRAGAMPPPGVRRPDKVAYDGFRSWLETSLDSAAAATPNPGRTDTFRRLNRTEYQNAIRDLMAYDVDVAAMLPADDTSRGFDNISVGGLSPTLFERYLAAAQKISRGALGSAVGSPVTETIMVREDLTQDDQLDGLPFGTRGGTTVRYFFPVDAEYTIQVRLGRNRDGRIAGRGDFHQMEVSVDGQRVQVFPLAVEVRAGRMSGTNIEDQDDQALNVRVPMKAGPHDIWVTFLKRSSALVEGMRQPWQRRHNADYADQRTQPVVFSVGITGPFAPTGPGDTPSRQRILVCRPAGPSDEASCARTIIATFARRAYRAPVAEAKLKALLGFYQDGRTEGSFEAGIEAALQAVLTSPEFLFRIEREPKTPAPNHVYRVSDLELASRLSFFLWSSIPDDELLDVAIRGELNKPAVLERQVKRMLADGRSEALVNNFAGQWLFLRNLASTTPDPRLFPDFDDGLRQALRRETELFFESILRENRSVLDLLRADYTFMNERLAKHYGIPNVYGSRFRRVTLSDENRRGLLGQGSVLTVTAYATRTSPVLRGKWVLENILGSPPPPVPPNVPPLDEKKEDNQGKVLNMRERMARHRSSAVCASCHSTIDPAGFPLEQFDAVGKWRDLDEGFKPVDASGGLPDGAKFNGVTGLRQALLAEPDRFVTALTEKLLTYALGRGLEYYDMPAVRKIVRDGRADDNTLSSVILGIIKSQPFQMRRSSQS